MKLDVKKLWQNKTVRIVVIALLALALLLAAWKVFYQGNKEKPSAYVPTQQETRLALLLSKIEGVGEVTVMIGEENGEAVSAIVVFDGEDEFLTRIRVIEVAANALGIDPNRVQVYPA